MQTQTYTENQLRKRILIIGYSWVHEEIQLQQQEDSLQEEPHIWAQPHFISHASLLHSAAENCYSNIDLSLHAVTQKNKQIKVSTSLHTTFQCWTSFRLLSLSISIQ